MTLQTGNTLRGHRKKISCCCTRRSWRPESSKSSCSMNGYEYQTPSLSEEKVLTSLVSLLQLAKQRAFIRHEKRRLLLQNALLEAERERFDASLASDWFCSSAFPSGHDRRVTIDVGGQLFEISRAVASKDSGSLLAAFVGDESPLSAMEWGCFRIDRDW